MKLLENIREFYCIHNTTTTVVQHKLQVDERQNFDSFSNRFIFIGLSPETTNKMG
jgi:hypothetical protein